MLGLTDRMEPWSGGDVPLALRQSPPLPSGEEIAAARVPAQAFVGGGAWGLTRAARLAGMGWTIDPTADVAVEEGAVMLAALAGDERLAPALAAALAVRQAGEDAVAEEDAAVIEAVAAVRAQLGELLDALAGKPPRGYGAQRNSPIHIEVTYTKAVSLYAHLSIEFIHPIIYT